VGNYDFIVSSVRDLDIESGSTTTSRIKINILEGDFIVVSEDYNIICFNYNQ